MFVESTNLAFCGVDGAETIADGRAAGGRESVANGCRALINFPSLDNALVCLGSLITSARLTSEHDRGSHGAGDIRLQDLKHLMLLVPAQRSLMSLALACLLFAHIPPESRGQ